MHPFYNASEIRDRANANGTQVAGRREVASSKQAAALLARAIRATFERGKTTLPTTTPVALTATFAEEATKNAQWSGFLRKAGARDAGTLAETIAAARAFVEAPLVAAANGTPAPGTWRAGAAWG